MVLLHFHISPIQLHVTFSNGPLSNERATLTIMMTLLYHNHIYLYSPFQQESQSTLEGEERLGSVRRPDSILDSSY